MADSSVIFRLLAKDETEAGLKSAESKFKGAGEVLKGIMEAAVVEKGFDFLKDAVIEADQAQKVMNLTAGAIASTGGAANVSAEDVRKLAEQLAVIDGVVPTVVQNTSNMLLTFTNIKNVGPSKIFDDATQAALNMSAAITHGNTTIDSAQGAAKALGRALNDPIGGLAGLTKQGIQFTQAQKDMIKHAVLAGDGIKAQGVILDQVKAKFGNAGTAMATPFQKMKAAVETAKEDIGMQLMPTITRAINAAIPVVMGLAGAFGKFFGFVQSNANVLGPLVLGLAGVYGAVKLITLATRGWAQMQEMVDALTEMNPIILALTAVAVVVIALAVKFKGFRDFLFLVFGDIAKVVATVFKYIWDTVSSVITHILDLASHIPFIGDKFKAAADGVRAFTGEVNNAIAAVQNFDFVASSNALFQSLTNMLTIPSYSAPAFNSGASLGGGFNQGVQKGLKGAGAKTKQTMAQIQDNVNKAIDTYKNGLVQKFAAVGSIIKNDVQGPAGTFGIVGNLNNELIKAKQFATDIATLRKRGLNPAALNELINAGPEQGGAAARDLAGASNQDLAQVNSLESQIQSAANSYANTQVKAEFKGKPDIAKNVVNLNLDMSGVSNDALVKALRQAIRVKGGNVQVVLGGAA